MSTKRALTWGLILVAIGAVVWYRSLVFPQPKSNETTRIVFITGGTDPYWQLTVKGAEAAASKHNADLRVKLPKKDEGLTQQMQILVGVDDEKVDGVAISPLSAEHQTRLLNLLAKKLKVVTFDSDAPLSERQYYVGTSNYAAGKTCYDLVNEAMPSGGKVAVLISNLTKSNTIERKAGFEDAFETTQPGSSESDGNPTFEIIGFQIDEGDRSLCRNNVLQVLEEHPDVGCLVGMNGYHGPVLIEVLQELDKIDQVKLITFDEAPETLDGIEAGHVYATVAQDPYMYGYEAVRMLTELHRRPTRELPIMGGGSLNVRSKAIRKADLPEFRNRLKRRLAETNGGSKEKE